MLRQAQQTYRYLMAFPEPVEGFQALNKITLNTPPLLVSLPFCSLKTDNLIIRVKPLYDAFVRQSNA